MTKFDQATGLWGGLWVFPEAGAGDIKAYCRRSFACEIASVQELAPLEHGFTHFRLQVRPLLCRVRSVGPAARQGGGLWIDLEAARDAAVPAPVEGIGATEGEGGVSVGF